MARPCSPAPTGPPPRRPLGLVSRHSPPTALWPPTLTLTLTLALTLALALTLTLTFTFTFTLTLTLTLTRRAGLPRVLPPRQRERGVG